MTDVGLIYGQMSSKDSTIRYGQVFFNHLHAVNPGLAKQLRFTGLDPFYHQKVSQECVTFCAENWNWGKDS
jgi:hypothetical protein